MSSEFLSIDSFVLILAFQLSKSFYLECNSYICMQQKHSQECVVNRQKKNEYVGTNSFATIHIH